MFWGLIGMRWWRCELEVGVEQRGCVWGDDGEGVPCGGVKVRGQLQMIYSSSSSELQTASAISQAPFSSVRTKTRVSTQIGYQNRCVDMFPRRDPRMPQ